MYQLETGLEKRMFVKIRLSKNSDHPSLAKVVYYRNDMTIEFYHRWAWFFRYREALLRVKYPRSFLELTSGSYDYVLPVAVHREKVKNLLLAAKRERTKLSRKVENARYNWNELFPIEEHPLWIKVQNKLNYYEERVVYLSRELEEINK